MFGICIHEVAEDFLRYLMFQERTIDTWSSLLARLPLLDKKSKDSIKLVASIDQSALRENSLNLHKK